MGKLIGRHKMAPRISPGKTWEGTIGGLVGGLIVVVAINWPLDLPVSTGEAAMLGLVLPGVAVLADLGESALKRGAGVKDTSVLVPGHGGFLDRLDSLLFTVPLVYYFASVDCSLEPQISSFDAPSIAPHSSHFPLLSRHEDDPRRHARVHGLRGQADARRHPITARPIQRHRAGRRQQRHSLEEQAREFKPRHDLPRPRAGVPRGRQSDGGIAASWADIEEIAAHPDVDLVVIATVGAAGLGAVAGRRAGREAVALANKEVLVMAGHILTAEARRSGAELRPVDSEHSAIWQCLWGESSESVERLVITASGGALRDLPEEELERVTAEQALRHPNWQMGKKITVDSATLMNKGLECIEARWLFDVPMERIEVLLHRESIIHSLVEFRDGALKAQLGVPDMRLPIQCALNVSGPRRRATSSRGWT